MEKYFEIERNEKDDEHILLVRGERGEYDRLLPCIYRPDRHYIDHEAEIYKETFAQFPEDMQKQELTVERLILMQHFELPTRLLDASKNPLIGLFFACRSGLIGKNTQEDGRVYVFSIPAKEIKFCDSDTVGVLANLCKCTPGFNTNDKGDLESLLHEMREDKSYYDDELDRTEFNKVICLRGRMNNPRIIRQDGYFFLFGCKETKKICADFPQDWIVDRLTIPDGAKENLLNELETMNINEFFLFPDYIHLFNELDKKYG
jgi:hypothetical protein